MGKRSENTDFCLRMTRRSLGLTDKDAVSARSNRVIYNFLYWYSRWGAVSPGVFLVDSYNSRRFPLYTPPRSGPRGLLALSSHRGAFLYCGFVCFCLNWRAGDSG